MTRYVQRHQLKFDAAPLFDLVIETSISRIHTVEDRYARAPPHRAQHLGRLEGRRAALQAFLTDCDAYWAAAKLRSPAPT